MQDSLNIDTTAYLSNLILVCGDDHKESIGEPNHEMTITIPTVYSSKLLSTYSLTLLSFFITYHMTHFDRLPFVGGDFSIARLEG